MPRELPWSPRSRSQEGMQTEKVIAKARGARLHPRSGAGKIKDDASTPEEVLEVKDANLSHTIKASDIIALFRRAAQQGKSASYIIYFKSIDCTLTCHITRGKK